MQLISEKSTHKSHATVPFSSIVFQVEDPPKKKTNVLDEMSAVKSKKTKTTEKKQKRQGRHLIVDAGPIRYGYGYGGGYGIGYGGYGLDYGGYYGGYGGYGGYDYGGYYYQYYKYVTLGIL